MGQVRYLYGQEALPFELDAEALIDSKYNHHETTADILHDPTSLHFSARYVIAVDVDILKVLGVLQLQRVLTGDPPYPPTLRITQLVVHGFLSECARHDVASQLVRTALHKLSPGHRLQIYTPLPCDVMQGPLLSHCFKLYKTLNYKSKPCEGMFLLSGQPPPSPAEVEALNTRQRCTSPGCENLASIHCPEVCFSSSVHPLSF